VAIGTGGMDKAAAIVGERLLHNCVVLNPGRMRKKKEFFDPRWDAFLVKQLVSTLTALNLYYENQISNDPDTKWMYKNSFSQADVTTIVLYDFTRGLDTSLPRFSGLDKLQKYGWQEFSTFRKTWEMGKWPIDPLTDIGKASL
jgi:hypothetical protein